MDLEKEKIHSQWFFDDNDILDEIWRQMSQERDKQAIVACHAEVPRDLSQFLPPLPLSRAPPAFIINLSRKRFFSSFFPFYDTNFEFAAIFVCQPAKD